MTRMAVERGIERLLDDQGSAFTRMARMSIEGEITRLPKFCMHKNDKNNKSDRKNVHRRRDYKIT